MIRLIAAVRDLLILGALIAGVAVGLAAVAGPPLPRRLPSGDQLRGWLDDPLQPGYAAATAATLGWLLWTAMTAAIGMHLAARLHHLTPQLTRICVHLPGPVRTLTATVLGAAAITATATPTAAATTPTATDTTPNDNQPTSPAATIANSSNTTAPATAHHRDQVARTPADNSRTHQVSAGDTLSSIAADHLDDADRWPDIFALNRGTHFGHPGGTLTDPDLIYPGWILDLPSRATAGQEPGEPTRRTPTAPAGDPATRTAPTRTAPTPAPPSVSAVPTVTTCEDDGVTGPAPTQPSAATTPPPPSTASPGAPPSRAAGGGDTAPAAQRGPRGLQLPTGSWIDLGLALAIVTAVTLIWAHRRRRYTPRPPSAQPRLDDPDLAPMPPIVHQVRRGLLHRDPDRPARAPREGPSSPSPPDHTGVDGQHHGEVPAIGDHRGGRDTGGERTGDRAAMDDPTTATPVVPSLHHPLIDVWPPTGLGLTGAGAPAAARGFLTAALATGNLATGTLVVMPADAATTLLGPAAAGLPCTPRLTVTVSLDDSLDLLDTHVLHRSRLLYRHDADNLTALRTADPGAEPLPPILLIADTASTVQRTRIAALLAQGQRLDIHGVLLGSWPDGDTVVVAADGATTPADESGHHSHHLADLGRLSILDTDETADLIATLAESHTGHLPPRVPAEQNTAPRPVSAPTASASAFAEPAAKASHAVTVAASADDTGQDVETPVAPVGLPSRASAPQDPVARSAEPAAHLTTANVETPAVALTPAGRVEVTVLGRPGIVGADPQRSLRAKSLELLTYLTVQNGAAAVENILDDLLPDAPASKAVHRLHTYVSDLRAVLRHNAGPGSYLTHPHQRYVLNDDVINTDLWRMRAALRDAETADTDQQRIAALRQAVDTYRGHLADGYDFEWAEPYREGIRRQALDATLSLAGLLDKPDQQLAVLTAAINHSPYCEALYQAAMRAHAALGNVDAVRALRRSLTRRLGEIDAEPDRDTLTLADDLVTAVQRASTQPRAHHPSSDRDGATA